MTKRVITVWRVNVTLYTTTVSPMCSVTEKRNIHFKGKKCHFTELYESYGSFYEGELIGNQPIPFSINRDITVFMPCFNSCFIHWYKIAPLSSHSLIRY